MAKADPSIEPRILESARREFLAQGFEKASLKQICEQAQVTTGALYKRYASKEELFCAVVAQTVADLEEIIRQKSAVSPADLTDHELIKAWDMDVDYMMWWFQYLYDRHDGFVLLLRCAAGTRYANFTHDWVAVMTDATEAFYQEAFRRGLTRVEVPKNELHVLLSAFWTTIYEPFIHDFSWQEIESHCLLVCRMFDWYAMFGFPKEAEAPR